jgi:hypothetical protein
VCASREILVPAQKINKYAICNTTGGSVLLSRRWPVNSPGLERLRQTTEDMTLCSTRNNGSSQKTEPTGANTAGYNCGYNLGRRKDMHLQNSHGLYFTRCGQRSRQEVLHESYHQLLEKMSRICSAVIALHIADQKSPPSAKLETSTEITTSFGLNLDYPNASLIRTDREV